MKQAEQQGGTSEIANASKAAGIAVNLPSLSAFDTQSPLELLSSTTPDYPPLAKQLKVEGTVVLKAVIAKSGGVRSVERVSGPPMLADAAMKAVRVWRYRPASVNGEPVDAESKIVMRFVLHPQISESQ